MMALFIHRFFAAVILAGVFAVIIGGAAFANEGFTDLHKAARDGDIAEVNRLIDDGADVNAKDIYDFTPLHAVAIYGQTETAIVLIKAGAIIDAKDHRGGTPLHAAVFNGESETMLVLIKWGANLYARTNEGKTPLDIAREKHGKDSKIVRLLEEKMILLV